MRNLLAFLMGMSVCMLAVGRPVHLVQEKDTCDTPVAELVLQALSNDVLENTAIEWGGRHQIVDWNYTRLSEDDFRELVITKTNPELGTSTHLACVFVSYSVAAKMPSFVRGFTSKVAVNKTVCVTSDAIFERLEFKGLPLLDVLTVSCNMRLSLGSMRVSTASDVVLPGMLSRTPFVSSSAEAYVQKRWRETNDAFVRQLCAAGRP